MKVISNKLYEEYTKTTIDYHTDYSKLTKEQLYDTFKFHCQGQRLLNEVVDYIYNLIQEANDRKRDNKPFAKEIYHAMCNQLEDKNKQLKEVIEEVREYMKKNRTRYIYQDSLGEDWRFDDLDVYSELLQILDKAKENK